MFRDTTVNSHSFSSTPRTRMRFLLGSSANENGEIEIGDCHSESHYPSLKYAHPPTSTKRPLRLSSILAVNQKQLTYYIHANLRAASS